MQCISLPLRFTCKSRQIRRPDERTRTAHPCSSYECAVRRCRSSPGVAIPAFLSGLLCSGLPRVAPYCAPGGVRVVSEGRPYAHDGLRCSLTRGRCVREVCCALLLGCITTFGNPAAAP